VILQYYFHFNFIHNTNDFYDFYSYKINKIKDVFLLQKYWAALSLNTYKQKTKKELKKLEIYKQLIYLVYSHRTVEEHPFAYFQIILRKG
jgi:hypothetical protein